VVTAVSDYLKQRTEAVFLPTVKINRVHNFVDLDLFRHVPFACHRTNFAKADQVVFLHVSNFRPIKRVGDVVRIFAEARKRVDAVLLLVGEGPSLREARELSESLGVQDSVKFLGKQMDVTGILSAADILLFPSEEESFGLAPLEAMACEIPVVAASSGGIPEVVRHGECGYLARVGDVKSMAAYSVELALSKEKRVQMGKAGRRIAEANFHPDVILPQYEALYQEAIAKA
jgi:N-acetyl-alpha-D-glucosaminyl L-malate synthase BshA